MNYVNKYTSTGSKLLNHPGLLAGLKIKMAKPISVAVAPTSRCNLKCSFCSNSKREKHEDLDFGELKQVILGLAANGLRTVEITGGGDPTMYDHINALIRFCDEIGLQVGMITNGVALRENVRQEYLDKLKWLRISINALEYVEEIDIPNIKGTLGFSLCVHKNPTVLPESIEHHIKKYKPSYVRVVPDCLPGENEESLREICRQIVERYGEPFFFQEKNFTTPERCWWGYIKPFILHDGYVYPCSSVVLNSGAEGLFHQRYRWLKMEDLVMHYAAPMEPYPTDSCDRCVFGRQNADVDSVINPNGMEAFI